MYPHGHSRFLTRRTISLVRTAGFQVLRYGLVFLLVGGVAKFADFEAAGIRLFIANSPFMSWMYTVLSVQAASDVIGAIEITLGLGILLRRWFPRISGIASLAAAGMFVVTFSFFFTTPGVMALGSKVGGFLMKDLILLGGALAIAAEALSSAGVRGTPNSPSLGTTL